MDKTAVFVIAPEKFYDDELFVPQKYLEAKGVKVDVASTDTKESIGVLGGKARPSIRIKDVAPSRYDLIVVVGGPGAVQHLWPNAELGQLLHQARDENKVVGGICAGAVKLATDGLLTGKKATTYSDDPSQGGQVGLAWAEILEKNGARFQKLPAVTDGKMITSNGPMGAQEFAKQLATSIGLE